ncbi:MAG TPA: GNAT family N-acetyltransferase, partial [Gaiellales bacterium]|nr:GNAT family N-acetyltransferase [Gaiellales bacterium]
MLADVVTNHASWFGRSRRRIEVDGVTLFLGSADAAIAFPPAGCDPAGAVALAAKAGAREIGCWGLAPDDALGRRLLGLGFQNGWQPQWMGIEPGPAEERPAADESPDCGEGLPYAAAAHRAAVREPGVHHFVVRDGGALVGHALLNVAGTTAGIYDMGVGFEHRRRGHCLALTRATAA